MTLPEEKLIVRYYAIKLRLPLDVGEALERLSPDQRSRGRVISELILAADKKSTRQAKKGLAKA